MPLGETKKNMLLEKQIFSKIGTGFWLKVKSFVSNNNINALLYLINDSNSEPCWI